MPPDIIAIKCNVRRVYAWCSRCGEICNHAPDTNGAADHAGRHEATMLVAVGAPVESPTRDLMRWMLWNMAQSAALDVALEETTSSKLLVSSCLVWTHGHHQKILHAQARATARNEFLRDCQAMIWMFQQMPTDWMPLARYLENI